VVTVRAGRNHYHDFGLVGSGCTAQPVHMLQERLHTPATSVESVIQRKMVSYKRVGLLAQG